MKTTIHVPSVFFITLLAPSYYINVVSLQLSSSTTSFVVQPHRGTTNKLNVSLSSGGMKRRGAMRRTTTSMFLDGIKNDNGGALESNKSSKNDVTTLGNLIVPSVGVGTISWSSKSCK
jgi:hypothetical protein